MSNSYTQDNTAYDTSTGNTGLRDNDPSLSSQNPSSGHDTTNTGSGYERRDSGITSTTGLGNILGTNTTEHHGIGSGTGPMHRHSGSAVDTGRNTYASSPLNPTIQPQYGRGTATGQYDSSRIDGEGMDNGLAGFGQQQYGRANGQGTGVGHHKAHHEGHLHEHGSDEATKANYESCTRNQAAGGIGAGGNDINTTATTGTSLNLRPGEIVIETLHLGVARDDDPLARTGTTTMGSGTGYVGDTTTGNRGGVTTTGLGTGGDTYGETGMGAKPTMMDKIIGGAEKVTGKLTSNTEMYQRGEERTAGEFEIARKN